MSIVNNNYRERCGQTFLAHGVIIVSICTLKAALAKTAIRTGCLGLAALAVSAVTISAVHACFEPETVDINSFYQNFSSPFKEGAAILSGQVLDRIEMINKIVNDFFVRSNDN